jgi:pimeloyl-ACP methyl ester carboxylesterase
VTVALIDRGDGLTLAYDYVPGQAPTLVFLPGFMSDMTGDKATMLAALAAAHGRACLRLDYSGHGRSGGRFEDGTIGRWAQDAQFLIDRLTEGRIVLVGSSMGGWIALLVALARPSRVQALVGIAAAPDFTEELIWAGLPEAARIKVVRDGSLRLPGAYGNQQVITRGLIEDGRRHLLLGGQIALACPLRLLHGQQDSEVPWQTALRIAERVASNDVQVTLVKDGSHRLSRPQDLATLGRIVTPLLLQDGA